MIAVEHLVTALRELSDEGFQRKAWRASSGPVVSSFTEQVCQVFDDTGLSDALDNGECPPELSDESYAALRDLDRVVRSVDQRAAPEKLLVDPQVEKVRTLARRALEFFDVE